MTALISLLALLDQQAYTNANKTNDNADLDIGLGRVN
jgi:hypothetical protein